MKASPRMAFFGTSEFVGSIQNARFLRRLIGAGIRPAAVVTALDIPRGRGRKSVPQAVKSAALEFGLPILQPPTLKGFSEALAKQKIELSLVVAYGKILPPDVLLVPRFGSLNIHPSLLPRWRGPTPIQATILAGDSVTGVTILQMDAEMDHGPIIARREFPLGERVWTAPALSDALTDLALELFLEVLGPWTAGKVVPQPQDHAAATYSRALKKEDGHINWTHPAEEIERMVRAFLPWPGAYTFWQRHGNQLRLVVEEAAGREQALERRDAPGTVLAHDEGLAVQTGGGVLVLKRVKREGQRSVGAEEFRRGHPAIAGAVLH